MKLNSPGAKGYTTNSKGIPLKVTSFEVFEVPKFSPKGEGEHSWGLLEKVNRNTIDVVKEIARWSGANSRDIGYAGLKDKKGRTVQWISSPAKLPPVGHGFKFWVIIKSTKKLKKGNLLGNWFRLGVETDQPEQLKKVVEQLKSKGLPNFFGPQRFSTNNHEIGELLVRGQKKEARKLMESERIPMTRRFYTLLEDAYGSYLFNQVLSQRLSKLKPIEGDIMSRLGPTGPIFGKKLKLATGVPGEIEDYVLKSTGLSLKDFPGDGKRRPLSIPIKGLECSETTLRFFLPKGSYATVLLREIVKENQLTWFHPTSSSSYV